MPVGALPGAVRIAAIAFVAIAATPLIAAVVAGGVDRNDVARMVAF